MRRKQRAQFDCSLGDVMDGTSQSRVRASVMRDVSTITDTSRRSPAVIGVYPSFGARMVCRQGDIQAAGSLGFALGERAWRGREYWATQHAPLMTESRLHRLSGCNTLLLIRP